MDEQDKQLLMGLQEAMQAERHGHTFYKTAAMTTQDPQGRETFELLAQEELAHFEFLAAHYKSLQASGKLSSDAHLQGVAQVGANSPIFSDQLKERIKDAHFEMSALSIAVQLELNAINRYTALAKEAKLPEVKAFFERLADWERSHHQAFVQQQQVLQQDYWSAAGFSPF